MRQTWMKLGVAGVSRAPRAVRTEYQRRTGNPGSSSTFHESHADVCWILPKAIVNVAQAEARFFSQLTISLLRRVSFGNIFTGRLFWEEPQPAERVPRRVPGGQGGVSSVRRPWC